MMINHCPICGRKLTEEGETGRKFRPFCSRRCQLVDLGAWLDEQYRIPAADDREKQDSLDT